MSSGCPVSLNRLRGVFTDWMASFAGKNDIIGGDKIGDRGLLFLDYQTSIERQFEFVTNLWVNNPEFSDAGNGHDPILGQSQDPTTRDRSSFKLKTPLTPPRSSYRKIGSFPQAADTSSRPLFKDSNIWRSRESS